ncbi:phosphatase PAP2 family protein [Mucilaginibacter sp. Bleaf8]|uniref:phosphatase PAP2 family protein n=1 Tax=Mucilaginibacter sp. Bleaf8 TaxID=2834430 RepID=UPI001BCA8B0F|nr:phosphatase PAP2 family protein [Mucilaginibacter sp. Bleaf8]MBS7563570.1 phosphatase PAP2 family protein [Mucilaginibacter sp. Bleaf8]
MPDYLLQLDRTWFYFVNHTLTNPVFDGVMPWFRNPLFWIPLYVFIIVFSIWRYRTKGIWLIMLLLLTVGVADFVSASIIKKMAKRDRPCRDAALTATVTSRVPCGTGYSFPSTHASDHFAMSIFLSLVYYRKCRWVWLWAILWAALVCFAQVYVGVHYPIDVLSGAAFGALTGTLFAYLFKRLQPDF